MGERSDAVLRTAMPGHDVERFELIHRGPHMLDELARIGRQRLEIADANREIAQRPGAGKVDRLDRHAFRRAAGGCWGHDADPDIAFDHSADRIEAAQLHAEAKRAPDAGRLAAEEALDGARPVEADEILVEHFG